MKPPRLAELQRQRELVRQHLAWLDAEIADANGQPRHETPPASNAAPADAPPRDVVAPPMSTASEPDPARAAATARRGCFVFALIAALLFAGTLVGIYLLKYRDRPLFFPEAPHEAGPAP